MKPCVLVSDMVLNTLSTLSSSSHRYGCLPPPRCEDAVLEYHALSPVFAYKNRSTEITEILRDLMFILRNTVAMCLLKLSRD